MKYATRVQQIEPSATVAVGNLAAQLKSDGADIIDLSVGEPDFGTPQVVIEAGQEALGEGKTGYTQSNGILQLRRAIAEDLGERGMPYTADDVIVTPGAKQALFETVQALVESGDEVILPTPAWVSYRPMIKMAGGDVTTVDTTPHEFQLEPAVDELAEKINDNTVLLVLNSPVNPTGAVYSQPALERIRDLAVDHDLFVLSDEIYRGITYGDDPPSPGAIDGMLDRTITVDGFSKTYAMTGWRLGYLAGPTDLVEQAAKVHSHSVTCAPNFVQHAGITALQESGPDVERMVSEFRTRRDHLINLLGEQDVPVSVPEGAFYVMIPVEDDDEQWCKDALEDAHVATVPGSAFDAPGYARIAYIRGVDELSAAIDRLTTQGLL